MLLIWTSLKICCSVRVKSLLVKHFSLVQIESIEADNKINVTENFMFALGEVENFVI